MTIGDYRNFDLLITRAGERFRAFVVDAPGGEASLVFDPPFAAGEVPRLGALMGPRRHARPGGQPQPPADLSDVGRRLFAAIFRDEVRAVLADSLARVEQEGAGLRLRLRFEADAADLATLPWETLYDADQGLFVGLGEASPILRYLPLPRSRSALLVEPPLRVLALVSSPAGLPALDVERESRAMVEALSGLLREGKFGLERLPCPTLEALQKRLLGEPVHILHFIGHGVFDEANGAGSLALEDAGGELHLVQGEDLAKLLRNHPAVRLAYLNACEGALASGESAFTGVAQALVRGGVPAVVAMQAEISDTGAIDMARAFYTALASGRPVDAALTQARVALSAAGTPEWSIPVLFSRSPDNRLFDVRQILPTPDCPYPGMSPFSEEQQALFFGRDREIEAAVVRLRQHPFLAVVGPSGSGKSSLVYAGVIPSLRRSRRFGPGAWAIRTMRPSDSRTAEGQAVPRAALAGLLGCAPDALAEVAFGGRTLLFVDQLEELFTLTEPAEAGAFLDLLGTLVSRPNLYIVLTVRADFYPDLMACSLWGAIRANRLELTPLGDDELWAAIVEPAGRVGVTLDEALAVRLIADASGEQGALPLVQETLLQLWDRVEGRRLGLAAYRDMAEGDRSGLEVAIDRRASLVYDNLPEEAQPLARRTFLRLIQFGEGRADTRRQQTVAELRARGDDIEVLDRTLARLTDSRLLTASGDPEEGAGRVDIAHEALIIGWPRLQEWLDQRRVSEQTRRRLEGKAAEWVRADKRGRLLDAYELLEAESWLASEDARELGFSQDLTDLVAASAEALAQAEAEKEAQRQRELEQAQRLAEEQHLRAEEQRLRAEEGEQAAGRLRRRLIMLTVAVVIALIAFGAAVWFGAEANSQRSNAKAALVTATLALGQAEVDANKAVRAAATATVAQGQAEIEAERAVRAAATATVAQGEAVIEARNAAEARGAAEANAAEAERQKREAEIAARSARAKELAALSLGQLDDELDLALLLGVEAFRQQDLLQTRQALFEAWCLEPLVARLLHAHSYRVESVASSADGRLASGSCVDLPIPGSAACLGGEIVVWDIKTGLPAQTLTGHSDWVSSLAWSSDGRLASASYDHTIIVWDPEDSQPAQTLMEPSGAVWSLAWSADERLASGSSDGTVIVWDLESSRPAQTLVGHKGSVNSVAWSADGRLASGSSDGTVVVWDLESSVPAQTLKEHSDWVGSVAWSADGRLASAAGDGTIIVWDLDTGQPAQVVDGHRFGIENATWLLDGQLASASSDGTVIVWDLERGQPARTLRWHKEQVNSVAWSSSGQLASASGDGTIVVWDLDAGQPAQTLEGHRFGISSVAWSADGRLASGSEDDTVIVWDLRNGLPAQTLEGHKGGVSSVAWSQDGGLASGSCAELDYDGLCRVGELIVWDLQNSRPAQTLQGHGSAVTSMVWSEEGGLASGSCADLDYVGRCRGGELIVWDLENGRPGQTLSGHSDWVSSLSWSGDGRLASGSHDGTIIVWDLENGRADQTLRGHSAGVYGVAWSQDGRLASGHSDGAIIIWDVERGLPTHTLEGHADSALSVAWSKDGRLASGSRDSTVRVSDMDPEEWLRQACDRAGRNLTRAEWDLYFPGEEYRKTCEEWPAGR